MLWFTVWTVLVLGTLVGAFFLLRDLWRRGKALLAELERAGEVADRLAERAEELREEMAARSPLHPVVLDDPTPARERRAALAPLREARAARRAARHDAAYARWRALSR